MRDLSAMTPEEALVWARQQEEEARERFKGQPKPRVSRAKRDDYPHFQQTGWAFWLRPGQPVRARRQGARPADGTLLGLRPVVDGGPAALVFELPGLGTFASRRADGVAEWAAHPGWVTASVADLEVPVVVWPVAGDAEPLPAPVDTAAWTLQTNKLEQPND